MGGAVESGVGIADKTSPRRAEIEESRAELRLRCEIRDKTKKELEFLLEGGDPLDLESGNVASVSGQSTSCIERHADQLVTSEAKGSFAFTASPHGDSVESSGRLGTNPCEPNSADNLMLFDAERELSVGNRGSSHPSRSNIVSSEKLSDASGYRRIGEHGDSTTFDLHRKAYKRRYRSRINRDGTRPSSADVNQAHGSRGSSLPSFHEPKDAKGFISDVENPIILSNLRCKSTSQVDDTSHKNGLTKSQQDIELDGLKAGEPTKDLTEGRPLNSASEAIACKLQLHDQHNRQSLSDVPRTSIHMDSEVPKTIPAMEGVTFADIQFQPGVTAKNIDNKFSTQKMNGFSRDKGEGTENDAHISASCGMKGLDSESSCTRTSKSIDGANDANTTKIISTDPNELIKDQISVSDKVLVLGGNESVKEKEVSAIGSFTPVTVESSVACQTEQEDGVKLQPEEELNENGPALKDEVKDPTVNEVMGARKLTESDSKRRSADPSVDQSGPNDDRSCSLKNQDSTEISNPDFPVVSAAPIEAQMSTGSDPKLTRTIDEDSILKEAKIIEAKRKRIAELSVANSPKKIRLKSHWDYVLEEMAWLANDFAQERIWKIAAAAQMSSRAAFTSCVRKRDNSFHLEAKKVAHSLAKSVMEFWQSVEEKSKVLDQQVQGEEEHSVQAYAMRFQKYKNFNVVFNPVELPLTPDGVSDMGTLDPSWNENLMEDNLSYRVLPGTMEIYRSSVEAHVAQFQRIAPAVIEEVETSACNAAAGFDFQDNGVVDERETNTYDISIEDSKNCGFGQKKQKHLMHAYGARPYEVSDISQMQDAENKVVHQSALLAKRPGGNLSVSIPTKRVRTASRRADDQSTLQGDTHAPYNVEVESAVKFEKQLAIGSAEVLMRHKKKKKKKAKHLNAAYEPRWQADSMIQNEQRDHLRKSHPHESNCSSGLLGKPMAKKQKTMRQSQDHSFENTTAFGGSVPSPVTSQMSNMSNPNKFIKMLGGRDRGRKQKLLKMSAGPPGSGSPWTLFEDQALVVLAHDLGPNWELVSDAINNTLQFKCIFRKAKECKERHNFLMDRTSGDGADSAEDSGSSQPYPSTLPGIPKGSARQLFQRLQGPMEEDTLKSHFEKIIIIGQKQHYHKTQDPKQLQQPHSSHTIALSQVCPNNLNGGPILTPLDLCDSTIAGNDMLPLGYQGPHSSGLAIPNQGTVTPMHSASGPTSSLQGSPSMIVGSNFSSSSSSLNSSVRDARYVPPRPTPTMTDEQQRMHQYNQMLSGRSVPQPTSSPGALPGAERGGCILPGGSGLGLVSGGSRGMPMARPGFQGIASPPVVNSGSKVSSGISSPNVHSGVGSGPGSSMLRPREALHMMRDSQKPMMPADLQMQAPPGNSQMPRHLSQLSSPFPNQTVSPPVPSYPLHHPLSPQQLQALSPRHHPHFPGSTVNQTSSPQQQAYAMRLAKEKKQQNRILQQPQSNASNSVTPQHTIHPQPQLPLQSNLQVQPQTGSPPVSISPMNSLKQQAPAQGAARNAPAGGTSQTSKQRQRQQQNQLSQANRPHPQQRQQAQSQQLVNNNVAKGAGRANLVAHPNNMIDRALVNGVSTSPVQFVPAQKHHPGQGSQSAKNLHSLSITDKSNLGHVPVAGSNHQQMSHQKLVTNNQLPNQRVAQQPNKLQTRDPSSDQNPTSSSSEMDKVTTLPQARGSASATQWQGSELLLDQTTLNSAKNMNSGGSMLSKASASATQNSQQRQLLPQHSQPQGEHSLGMSVYSEACGPDSCLAKIKSSLANYERALGSSNFANIVH
ncbi:Chromatin modification-related protein EAF1 A [Striga hermonthica]|uniref:Chromatin modification-related protein EAF1 A n=1 Tax=Striga hermonthica TaxID=68872 RepID=A0A9N7N9X8_STRHE|nr:Chromatin modification-related protein EAF1 A [Striga hermonthica]